MATKTKEVWIDMRTADRDQVYLAFFHERDKILRQILRLHTDIKSANENRFQAEPIELSFDFRPMIKKFDSLTVDEQNKINYDEETND